MFKTNYSTKLLENLTLLGNKVKNMKLTSHSTRLLKNFLIVIMSKNNKINGDNTRAIIILLKFN